VSVAGWLVTLDAFAADTTTRKRSRLSAALVRLVSESVEEVAPETFAKSD
jgi:hypothetical protein